ncbi:MAG: bifunctional DNA primase/polymerase, partial [Jiangellaceae bacterium]
MDDSTTTYGPFGRSAWAYRNAGWPSPLPLGSRPGVKSPPPTGYTGWSGVVPSGADIQTWVDGPQHHLNIGLHIPTGIYVLDVDQYGDKHGADNLEALAATLGPLPATWTSSARPGQSRHHFYRATLPDGRMWRDHPVPDTESLHRGHRYAVVWPSTNPDAGGAPYVWYDAAGVRAPELPTPGDLTELPAAWIKALSQDGTPVEGSAAGSAETQSVIGEWATDPSPERWCAPVRDWWAAEHQRLTAVMTERTGNVRDSGRVMALINLGMSGHIGIPHAIAYHQDLYVRARSELRGVPASEVVADHWRQVRGAVGKLAGDQKAMCRCSERTPPATPVGVALPWPPPAANPSPAPVDESGQTLTPESVGAELEGMPADVNLARMRDVVPLLAGLTVAQRQEWRSLFKRHGMPFGQFDELIKAVEAEQRRGQLESLRADRKREGWIQLAPPHNPMTVARQLLARTPATGETWHRGHWRGEFYDWTGTHWAPVDDADIRHWVYQATERAYYADNSGDEPKEPEWLPNTRKVNAVVDALGDGVLHRSRDDEHEPCIALANCVYDLATDTELPHHPSRWNLTALPFDFDRSATCPGWLAFLEQVLPADSIVFLQEWMGYL